LIRVGIFFLVFFVRFIDCLGFTTFFDSPYVSGGPYLGLWQVPGGSILSSNVTSRNLLLSVPFYVYENLAWTTATWGRNSTMEELSKLPNRRKHFDDFFFMKSSLVHPMRTLDPNKAKIFVIRLLMNAYADQHYHSGKEYKLCHRHDCNVNLMYRAVETLEESKWFQQ